MARKSPNKVSGISEFEAAMRRRRAKMKAEVKAEIKAELEIEINARVREGIAQALRDLNFKPCVQGCKQAECQVNENKSLESENKPTASLIGKATNRTPRKFSKLTTPMSKVLKWLQPYGLLQPLDPRPPNTLASNYNRRR